MADRVARSAVLTRGEPVTCGRHLRLPAVSPGTLGQRARRHYWLAPRSDDAVGAAGIRISSRALARLHQLEIDCRRFGLADSASEKSNGPMLRQHHEDCNNSRCPQPFTGTRAAERIFRDCQQR